MRLIIKKIGYIKRFIQIHYLNWMNRHVVLNSFFYVNRKYRVAYYLVPKVLSSSICQLMLKDLGSTFEQGCGHEKHREYFDYRLSLGGGQILHLPLSVIRFLG